MDEPGQGKGKVGRKPKVGYTTLHTKIPETSKARLDANAFRMGVSMGDILHSLIMNHLPHVGGADLRNTPLGFGLAGNLYDAVLAQAEDASQDPQAVLAMIADAADPGRGPMETPQATLGRILVDERQGLALLRKLWTGFNKRGCPAHEGDIVRWHVIRETARTAIFTTITASGVPANL
jgi:hypothetical protein